VKYLPHCCVGLTALALSMCGGRVGPASGSAGSDDAGEAHDGAPPDAGEPGDAGWTQCTSPAGFAVCEGPSCPMTCGGGSCSNTDVPGVAACINPALIQVGGPQLCGSPCADGTICVAEIYATTFFCTAFDMGVLFAQNGAADRVRYADMGSWTGEPLPVPTSCPSVAGLQLCGGSCDACPPAEVCTGRSPLHPYGFCTPPESAPCGVGRPSCNDDAGTQGQACMTFTVDAAAQGLADQWGICMPAALCQAAAVGLPGGATCSL
jgi:hypothetical protein